MSVKRGAYCNTDHHLVCARLEFDWKFKKNVKRSDSSMKHFDVRKLASDGWGVGGYAVAGRYIETVLEKGREFWPVDGVVKEKWQAVSAVLLSAATEVLETSS